MSRIMGLNGGFKPLQRDRSGQSYRGCLAVRKREEDVYEDCYGEKEAYRIGLKRKKKQCF